jgi:hypothetical protein
MTTSWRCLESPTSAHHWVYTDDESSRTCKHCHEVEILKAEVPLTLYNLPPWQFYEVASR